MKKRGLLLFLTVALVLTVFAVPVRAEEDNLCGPNARWKLEDGVLTIYGTGECFSRPWWGMSFHTVVVESGITMVDDNVFKDSPDLVSVTLADTVLSISKEAFANCPKLERIDLGSSLEFIGPGAFWNCTALKDVQLPASLLDLGRGAFFGCTALTSIDLPAGLLSMADICFQGSGLTRVEIPAGMTMVGKNLFEDCKALTEAVIHLESAMNMVVIKCHGGMAQAACACLDQTTWKGVVGTLAGDDTIFVVMKTTQDAEDFVEELRQYIQ